MKKLIESNRLFDEKNQNGFKKNPDDRSEDIIQLNEFKHNTTKVKNVKEILLEIHNKYILKKPLN
jgi:hypothetical protein